MTIIIACSHATNIQLEGMTIKWMDTKCKVLIDVLVVVSGGRFSNLSNKKDKWISIRFALSKLKVSLSILATCRNLLTLSVFMSSW